MRGSQSPHEADQSHDQGRGAMAERHSTSSEYFVRHQALSSVVYTICLEVWGHLEMSLLFFSLFIDF